MLIQLLEILRQSQGGMAISEISRRLGTDAGVVSGMLQVLIEKGRIVQIGPDGLICGTCPLQSGCNLLEGMNSRYVLVPRDPAAASRQMESISASGPTCNCGRGSDR